MTIRARLYAVALGALMLSACGGRQPEPAPTGEGAVAESELTGNLADQIKIDPSLAAAQSTEPPPELPADQRTPAAINAAKAEAAKLAGGTIAAAPAPSSDSASEKAIAEAGARLAGGPANCPAKVTKGPAWAARVPAALAAYPRGHVIDAAGSDAAGCSLRVLNFVTPVGIEDVLGYYYTRVRADGMSAARRTEGADAVLGGGSAVRAYVIYARPLSNGLTEVDIITTGS